MFYEILISVSIALAIISIIFLKRSSISGYKNKMTKPHELTAFIVRGNKQIKEHVVIDSVKFEFEGNTYIIKQDCIFLKKEDGLLKQCIIYVEGNPNPYDFKKPNIGLDTTELNDVYGTEFYKILVKCQYASKMVFIWLFILITTVMSVLTFLFVLFGVIL